MRRMARIATRSEVKNTDLSLSTSACSRITMCAYGCEMPHTALAVVVTYGDVSSGMPRICRRPGCVGSGPSSGLFEPVAS